MVHCLSFLLPIFFAQDLGGKREEEKGGRGKVTNDRLFREGKKE